MFAFVNIVSTTLKIILVNVAVTYRSMNYKLLIAEDNTCWGIAIFVRPFFPTIKNY